MKELALRIFSRIISFTVELVIFFDFKESLNSFERPTSGRKLFTGETFKNSSFEIPKVFQKPSKYLSTNAISKISFPAGTGVCVVNTVLTVAISLAISKETCFSFMISFDKQNI